MPDQKAASTCPVMWLMGASSSSPLGRSSPTVPHDEDDASLRRGVEWPKVKAQRQKNRRKKRGAEWIAGDEEAKDESDGEAEYDDSSGLLHMYNTVRGYVSAINEL